MGKAHCWAVGLRNGTITYCDSMYYGKVEAIIVSTTQTFTVALTNSFAFYTLPRQRRLMCGIGLIDGLLEKTLNSLIDDNPVHCFVNLLANPCGGNVVDN